MFAISFLTAKVKLIEKSIKHNGTYALVSLGKPKKYFSNLNTHDVTDNKTFWKTLKPSLTDQIKLKLI